MKGIAVLAVASLALFAVACNKGAAETALQETDQALAAARPELERYAPAELVALTAAARRARASLDEGHYTDALRVAQDLPAKVRAAADAAAAARQKQVAAWNEVSASLPALVEAIAARVAEAAATKTLPKGLDEARFAAARADLESVTQGWSEATAAFQGGDVPRAVRTALDVEAKAGTLAATLGLAPAPVAAAPVP